MNQNDGKLEELFRDLKGSFDTEEPTAGHQERFLARLDSAKGVVRLQQRRSNWWKPLSIAASVVLLIGLGFTFFTAEPSIEEQVAEISPEVSQTQFYFANLIEEQVKELESQSSPETEKMIADTMAQLEKLESNYAKLEQDLINGGDSKLILSAMITNFQTRIDLLQEVMNNIESIKNIKTYSDEKYAI